MVNYQMQQTGLEEQVILAYLDQTKTSEVSF